MTAPNQPNQPQQATIKLTQTPDYREHYANSVQIRVNLWDFFLQFGKLVQQKPNEVEISNFQGIYVSPQQAKALLIALNQNISQYEGAFGEIKIDPKAIGTGAGAIELFRLCRGGCVLFQCSPDRVEYSIEKRAGVLREAPANFECFIDDHWAEGRLTYHFVDRQAENPTVDRRHAI